MRQIFLFFLLLLTTAKVIAQQSPLVSGHCYKFGVTQSGIYKIDGNFLKKNGVDISKINPKNIHIFGNGGGMLPQANSAKRPNGLLENAIEITGEEDGKFDATDKILFYGQSPHKILYDAEKQQFSHETNIYSDSTFYFLVLNDTPGLRIKSEASSTQIADTEINIFDDYIFHESELKNLIGKSGREWYGEELNSANQFTLNFDLKLNGIVPNTKGKLTTAMVGATIFDKSNFKVFVNDKPVENLSAESINDYIYGAKGAFVKKITDFDLENNTTQKIKILLEKNPENTSRGFLDYWALQLKRPLNIIDELLIFRSVESQKFNYSKFIIGTTKSIKIWDITDPQIPDNLIFNNDIGNITFTINTKNTLREFIAFTDKSFAIPQSFKAVENQNIRAIQSPELLIITTKKFKEAAIKLADHRFKNDQITTEVVDAQEIFNEFSSGKPDVTAIRDFVKYLYSQTDSKLKYLLLFGDASFDIRNKDGDVTYQKLLSDYIPAYQSRESLDNVKSYSSDDYFGFMDDNEGEWPETEVDHDNHTLEIGVGRIPVKTAAEAQNMVEKLIYYDSKLQTLGSWRSKIVLASDDGDSNLHQKDSEDLGEIIKTKILNYRPEKNICG